MGRSGLSMQELIRRRRHSGFIGRRDELAAFRDNFELPPEDERHRFLFHVHGPAGVGKTFLLRELEQLARERGALTAYVDESAGSVPEALTALSAQCAQQGHPLKALDKLLATYRIKRHEAESAQPSDPAEQAGPSAGRLAVARAGLVGLGMVPVVGPFAGALDPAELAQGADRLRAALSSRLRSQEDVQLVMAPERVLSPALVGELDELAEARVPWIVLFFDTYERTAPFLDGWLRDLMTTERYGALPARLVVVLAGQRPFDTASWGGWADFVADLPLGVFSESEARGFLAAKGVTDEPVVAEVLRLSGGLPVLVSTLAENQPADRADVGDPSATAVERFLKWEQDPVRRAAALACALPRRLDEDVFRVAAAVDDDAAPGLYAWLCGLPFTSARGHRVQYHDVVRDSMLRLQRGRSRRAFAARHARLATAFAAWRAEAEEGVPADEFWERDGWREHRAEETYHRLCARPTTHLPAALADVAAACREGVVTGRHWARMLAEAGEVTRESSLREWGRDLLAALADDTGGELAALDLLLSRPGLDAAGRSLAHAARGRELRYVGAYERAVTEYDRAIELDPESVRAHFGRGLAHQAQGELARSLADFDRADTLSPDTSWILADRGETRRLLGDFPAALEDLSRAIALDPTDAEPYASRGVCLYGLDRSDEALADLDRALDLADDYLWAMVRRARVRRDRDEWDEAFADLDRAVELAPENAWIGSERGEAYRLAGRHEEAIAELGRVLSLAPDRVTALGGRGYCLAALGRDEAGMADLDRAVALDPDYAWGLHQRALLHLKLGDRTRAFADFDRAVEAATDKEWFLWARARALHEADRADEALRDLERILGLDPDYASALALRGTIHMARGAYGPAFADLDRAIELDDGYAYAYARRSQAGAGTGRVAQALRDIEACRAAGGDDGLARRRTGELLLCCGRADDALSALGDAADDHLRAVAHLLASRPGAACHFAESAREEDRLSGTLLLALARSQTEGLAEAVPLWRDLRGILAAQDVAEAWQYALVALARYALGDWDRADEALAATLAAAPGWDDLAELVHYLRLLMRATGVDAARLTPRLTRVIAARDAIQERWALTSTAEG